MLSIIISEVKMETNKKKKGLLGVVKKYGYYMMAGALVLGMSLAIAFSAGTSVENIEDTNKQPDVPSSTAPVVFVLPVDGPELIKGYSSTELFYNETLGQWESHKGVDLVSDNLKVYAVLAGTVTNVVKNYENGTTITIAHEDGFVSVYSSLDADVLVAVDDKVSKGQEIAKMSASSANEQAQGNHLHFELFKNGEKVDPSNYLTFENK